MPLIAVAAITAAGAFGGAALSSGAAKSAAKTQADAVTAGAADQMKSNEDTLAFQKQQAEAAYQSNESTRKANYDQYAAHEGSIAALGAQHGLSIPIPAYVPSVDPQLNGTIAGATKSPTPLGAPGAQAPAAAPTGNPTDPNAIMGQLTQNYSALGVKPTGPGTGPTDAAYYAQKIAQTGGLTPQNMSYWFGPNGRIASDLGKANAPAGSIAATTAPNPTAGPLGASATPLSMPQGSINSYLQRF